MTNNDDLFAELDRLGAAALGQPTAFGPLPTGQENAVAENLGLARAVQAVDAMPKGETRMLGVKRTIMRFSSSSSTARRSTTSPCRRP